MVRRPVIAALLAVALAVQPAWASGIRAYTSVPKGVKTPVTLLGGRIGGALTTLAPQTPGLKTSLSPVLAPVGPSLELNIAPAFAAEKAVAVFERIQELEAAEAEQAGEKNQAPAEGVPAPDPAGARELLQQVNSVMAAYSVDDIKRMPAAELAALAGSIFDQAAAPAAAFGGRTDLGPPTPEKVVALLKEIAPELQRLADKKFAMDPSKTESCAACGPVSLGIRGPLRNFLRGRFPESNIDIVLEVGRLDGPGEPVLHVFLKVVDRTSRIMFKPLAIIDLTAAQKPENMTALGFAPSETLILPWESGLYEEKYPLGRMSGGDMAHRIERIEKARGPLSQELEREAESLLRDWPLRP